MTDSSRTPDRKDVDKLSKAQQAAVKAARRELRKTFETVYAMYDDPADMRDALLDLVPAIASKYGNAGSVAAGEWYEQMRAKWFKDATDIDTTYQPDDTAIQETIRRLAGHLWDKDGTPADPDMMLKGLLANMDKWVKAGGRETIERAVKRDPRKPRYARVPQGAKTCAFCAMLAGRGFVYSSAEAAGAMGKYHNDCDCEIIPSWDKNNPKVAGYDDKAYYARYMEARRMLEDHTVPEELMDGLLKIKPYLEPKHKKSWYGPEDPNNVNSLTYLMRHLHPDEYSDVILEVPDFFIKDGGLKELLDDSVESFEEKVRKSKHSNSVNLFSKMSDIIHAQEVPQTENRVAYFSPKNNTVFVRTVVIGKDRPGHPAYLDFVHECAHAIDWNYPSEGNGGYYSAGLLNGRSFSAVLSADARSAFRRKYAAVGKGKVSERNHEALKSLFEEVDALLADGDDHAIHDLFQAGLKDLGEEYFKLSSFGHRNGYFTMRGAQESEAFAEMMAAQLVNEKSWTIMEKYFPNATKMFDQMVKDMNNEQL